MKEVFIVAAKRTPLGGFMGSLSHFTAPQLGAIAIKNAYSSINFNPQNIDAVYFGNVLSAGMGQAPARQAAKLADIPNEVDSTTINKVCSSGLKATVIGAQQIQLGLQQVVVTGGMESMSNVPHYSVLRQPVKLGDKTGDDYIADYLFPEWFKPLVSPVCGSLAVIGLLIVGLRLLIR